MPKCHQPPELLLYTATYFALTQFKLSTCEIPDNHRWLELLCLLKYISAHNHCAYDQEGMYTITWRI